jgi:hypothetical protein
MRNQAVTKLLRIGAGIAAAGCALMSLLSAVLANGFHDYWISTEMNPGPNLNPVMERGCLISCIFFALISLGLAAFIIKTRKRKNLPPT